MKFKTTITALALSSLITSCANTNTARTKPYPKDTCIVTDNQLGSMGTPVTKVYQGQEVKFCCHPCVAKFYANPQKYMAKLP